MLTTHFLVPRRNTSPLAAFGWSDFDRVFDQLWNGAGRAAGAATYAPRIDFTETDPSCASPRSCPDSRRRT